MVERVELREEEREAARERWYSELERGGRLGDWYCSQKLSALSELYSRSRVCSGVEVEMGLGRGKEAEDSVTCSNDI